MSFQTKNNAHVSKRIYKINSLNNPLILDILKIQDVKNQLQTGLAIQSNSKTEQTDDKNTLLSITGKELLRPNIIHRSSNKLSTKNNTQLLKKIELIIDENLQHFPQKNLKQNLLKNFDNFNEAAEGTEIKSTDFTSLEKNIQPEDHIQRYHEDVVNNHPAIYTKIVQAYKNNKKNHSSNQKAKDYAKKRFSNNKITGINRINNFTSIKEKPTRLNLKTNDTDPKNDQQKKKMLYFNIYREFQLLINLSNQCVMIPEPQAQYKAFVGKGNNGLLIKSILKSRPWWCIRTLTDVENCNLIWTEWKKPKYMKLMPNGKVFKKSDNLSPEEDNPIKIKNNKKLQYVSKILSQSKITQIINCLDFRQGEEVTKLNKRISESNFSLHAQKYFPSFQQKNVNKSNKLVNHIPGCFQLHSKKLLFANLKKYYQKKKLNLYDYVPQTYVISKGLNDPQYQRFLEGWQAHEKQKDNKNFRNIWICKPGQNSNRDNGITVAGTLNEIKNFITSHSSSNGMCSALIQKYMQNPFLYNKRKFDIRCYILITTVNGIVKGYWYQEGYIRTTSKQYNLKNIQNKFIHLTNDAVQKKGQTYGKFQNFNKINYQQFEKYLEQNYQGSNLNFKNSQLKMKQMATDLIHAVGKKLNPEKKQFSFELFGLDFMLDDKLEAYIIEANSNPCIEVEGNVLGRIIPSMLENMMRVAIDPIFPPPNSQSSKNTKYSPGNVAQQNKFTLVYDSLSAESNEEIQAITKQQQEEQRLMQAQIQRQNQEEV